MSGALQLLLVVVVTRGLGPGGAGVFLEAMALFVILGRVGELGASTGLVRTVPRFRALGRTVDLRRTIAIALSPVAIVSVSAAVALFACAPQAAALFFDRNHESQAATLIALLAPLVPLASGATVALAATRGFGTMAPYVLVQNIGLPLVRLALVFAAIAGGLGTTAAGLAWGLPVAVAFAVAFITLVVFLRHAERTDRSPSATPRQPRELATEFWGFSAPRAIAGILGIAVTWMDVLLVGALRSTREAAIYAAASRLSIIGAYAMQAIGMAIAPQVSALLARGLHRRVEALYRTATWWLMALVWPLYAVLAVFAPFVMGIFGPEFAAGATPLVILSLAMLVNLATGNVTTVLLMGGKSSWNLWNAAVSMVSNVTLNLILTPRMGITGAAIAWAISIVFVNLAPVVQVRIFLGLRPPLGAGFWIVAAATATCYGVLGLAVRFALGMTPATCAGFVVLGTALYACTLWRCRELLLLSHLRDGLRGRRVRGPLGVAAVRPAGESP
jgi:O-antigen/teichoic acid export membrane protein